MRVWILNKFLLGYIHTALQDKPILQRMLCISSSLFANLSCLFSWCQTRNIIEKIALLIKTRKTKLPATGDAENQRSVEVAGGMGRCCFALEEPFFKLTIPISKGEYDPVMASISGIDSGSTYSMKRLDLSGY
ncbi:MAG TPA: hypothetical protein PKW76_10985 [bacterium]|nr:hypothetical protein [bacterium]HPG46197.1 hypothetical protein [bacterium]HPM98175.1 hypothetical protein [bacterium]